MWKYPGQGTGPGRCAGLVHPRTVPGIKPHRTSMPPGNRREREAQRAHRQGYESLAAYTKARRERRATELGFRNRSERETLARKVGLGSKTTQSLFVDYRYVQGYETGGEPFQPTKRVLEGFSSYTAPLKEMKGRGLDPRNPNTPAEYRNALAQLMYVTGRVSSVAEFYARYGDDTDDGDDSDYESDVA